MTKKKPNRRAVAGKPRFYRPVVGFGRDIVLIIVGSIITLVVQLAWDHAARPRLHVGVSVEGDVSFARQTAPDSVLDRTVAMDMQLECAILDEVGRAHVQNLKILSPVGTLITTVLIKNSGRKPATGVTYGFVTDVVGPSGQLSVVSNLEASVKDTAALDNGKRLYKIVLPSVPAGDMAIVTILQPFDSLNAERWVKNDSTFVLAPVSYTFLSTNENGRSQGYPKRLSVATTTGAQNQTIGGSALFRGNLIKRWTGVGTPFEIQIQVSGNYCNRPPNPDWWMDADPDNPHTLFNPSVDDADSSSIAAMRRRNEAVERRSGAF